MSATIWAAGFTLTLARRADGTIRVSVRDASLGRPRPRQAGPLESSGRGLRLVEALATVWGTDLLPDGKVVWAELGRTRFPNGSPRPGGAVLTGG